MHPLHASSISLDFYFGNVVFFYYAELVCFLDNQKYVLLNFYQSFSCQPKQKENERSQIQDPDLDL